MLAGHLLPCCSRYLRRIAANPNCRVGPKWPAPDGLLQSSAPHLQRANSSAAGLRSGSEACCSHFLGSCRELTVHGFFCKTQIWKVSSQLRSQGAGVDFPSARKWSFTLSIFQPCPPSAALRNLPPPQSHSDTFRRSAAAGPFPALASSSAGDDKASSLRLWLLSFDAFR